MNLLRTLRFRRLLIRLLIIEDNVRLADALAELLRENGYETDTVYNGLDGLDYALCDYYDLMILDVMLPKNLK